MGNASSAEAPPALPKFKPSAAILQKDRQELGLIELKLESVEKGEPQKQKVESVLTSFPHR